MKYSEFKKLSKKKDCHLFIDLNDLEQYKEGQKVLASDHETKVIEGHDDYYEVRPIAVSKSPYSYLWYVYFVCPVCGQIHVHGLCEQKTEKGVLPVGMFKESRLSHCHDCNYHFRFAIA